MSTTARVVVGFVIGSALAVGAMWVGVDDVTLRLDVLELDGNAGRVEWVVEGVDALAAAPGPTHRGPRCASLPRSRCSRSFPVR